MKNTLIEIIKNKAVINWSFHDVKRALNMSKRRINNELLAILKELEMDGIIYQDEKDMYHKFPSEFLIATLEESKQGKYTAVCNNKRYPIANTKLNGALSGDKVIISVKSKKDYKVVKVLERRHQRLVCEVKVDEDNKKYLEPYNVSQKFNVSLGWNQLKRFTDGQRILVELSDEKFGDYYEATFIDTIGFRNDPDIDLTSIAVSNGFSPGYDSHVELELEDIAPEVLPEERVGRLDLRNETIFTIDGASTKDMDDAISIRKLDNGNYELSVHIAHVSHYVKKGSYLWKEAYERGNSLYLLDSVVPMLPQYLSNGICSLNEGEDRLTRSVIMEIDSKGSVIGYRIVKSVINSKKKMTYESVNEYFYTNKVPNGYEPFIEDLNLMKELSDILTRKRMNNGSIDFDSSEVSFVMEGSNVVDVDIKHQDIAEKMIENFMIYANCTVAQHVYYQDLPFAYRVHGIPSDIRLENTVKFLRTIGCKLEKVKNCENPAVIQNIIANLADKENYPILSTFVLRAMQKAEYSVDNIGHYGLSEGYYTHFTSPIRRLTDLVVHMLLDYYDNADNLLKTEVLIQLEEELKDICARASMQERNAQKAEYQAYKLASVKLMEENIGRGYWVYISDINPSFITVKTEDLIEGIIPLKEIGLNYEYNYDQKSIKLLDQNKVLLIGNKIHVNLYETSREYRELYFTFDFLWKEELRQRRLEKFNAFK